MGCTEKAGGPGCVNGCDTVLQSYMKARIRVDGKLLDEIEVESGL